MKTLKALIIAECSRIIEILEDTDKGKINPYQMTSNAAELKNKMHELRRDTLALENKMYGRG